MVFPLILSGRRRAPLVPDALWNWDASGWELDSTGQNVLSLTDTLQDLRMDVSGTVSVAKFGGMSAWQHSSSYFQGSIPGAPRSFPAGCIAIVIDPVHANTQAFCGLGDGGTPAAYLFEFAGYSELTGRQDSAFSFDLREPTYPSVPSVWLMTWDNTLASGSRRADLWSNGVLLRTFSNTTVAPQDASFVNIGRYPDGSTAQCISKVANFQVGTSYVADGGGVTRQLMGYWGVR